jgi:hypothetical protein
MTRRIVTTIITALKPRRDQDDVHFHTEAGRPYPCYEAGCTSPRFQAG